MHVALRPIAFFVLTVLLVLCLPAGVAAHAQYQPFSINRYTEITFEAGSVRFEYTITVGDLPARKLRERADDDGDGKLSQTESDFIHRWTRQKLVRDLSLQLDGQVPASQPDPGRFDLISARVDRFAPMRFRFLIEIPCPPGKHNLVYHDRSRFPDLEQTELFVRSGPGVEINAIARDRRDRGVVPRMFWNQGKAPSPVRIRFELGEQLGQDRSPEKPSEQGAQLTDDADALKQALTRDDLGFWRWLAILALAVFLGAVHALSPGHGKTLVAAYLVGRSGKMRHAVWLGLIVTFTHVFSVLMLGVVALWAAEHVVPERLTPWLSLVAGGMILLMGLWMLLGRRADKDHEHDHSHSHDHDHAHEHQHEIRPWQLLALGISGGMVPCLSATVVLLSAIYLGKIALGLLLILAFSLGLAATLIVLGILVTRSRDLLKRFSTGPRAQRALATLPRLSAVVVAGLGLWMVIAAIGKI